jgi:hypothetical protein
MAYDAPDAAGADDLLGKAEKAAEQDPGAEDDRADDAET